MSYKSLPLVVLLFCAVFMCFAQNQPVELTAQVGSTFRFAFLGDTRFTNPKDTRDSNATVRQTLVQAIADARPAFVSIGGDIVYHGDDANDWKTWDVETAIWHKHGIAMYPVLGNHDLSGGKLALDNYFQRFPELKNSRYYAVRAGCALLLVLDSSLAELSGPQGEWFAKKLDTTPSDVEFVFSGGGGAHPYRITRAAGDPFPDNNINYHFLLVEVEHRKLNVTMNRLQMERGKPNWTRPDTATISVPTVTNAAAAPAN